MGFTPNREVLAELKTIEADFRISWQSPKTQRMPNGEILDVGQMTYVCGIVDRMTRTEYAQAASTVSEEDALDQALAVARLAAKPMTPAQKADPRFVATTDLQKENELLRARLAELEGKSGGSTPGAGLPRADVVNNAPAEPSTVVPATPLSSQTSSRRPVSRREVF